MSKLSLAKTFKQAQSLTSKYAPEILTGFGIGFSISTTILAVKATPKALQSIEKEKETRRVDKLTPIDTVKVAWKHYIPAAVVGVSSVVCLMEASSVNAKRMAALTAAYQLSENALVEYKDAVIKTIGEKEEKAVREQVSETRVAQNPPSNSEVFATGKGYDVILEPTSQRYIKSSEAEIRDAVSRLNIQMSHDMFGYVSLNDFYDEIGLSHTDIGDNVGWNTEKGVIEIDFHLARDPDGKPCSALYFDTPPTWGFDKFR